MHLTCFFAAAYQALACRPKGFGKPRCQPHFFKESAEVDELLLRRARDGDAGAFEQLMTPLEGRIWRICWHYIGRREETSDCAQ